MANIDTRYQLQPGESNAAYAQRTAGYYTRVPSNNRDATGGASVMSQGSVGPGSVMPPAGYVAPSSTSPVIPPTGSSSSAAPVVPMENAGTTVAPFVPGSTETTPPLKNMPIYTSPNRGYTDDQLRAAREGQFAMGTKTPEQIRAEELKNMQATIDATNQAYQQKLEAELGALRPEQEAAMGRTNALSAMMGLSGSSSADTRTGAQGARSAEQNRLVTSKVNAEKMSALAAIYGKIDDRTSKLYDEQLKDNKEKQAAMLKDAAEGALEDIQNIAAIASEANRTFDDFKKNTPDELAKLVEQSGKSEFELRNEWNKAVPAEKRPITSEFQASKDEATGGTKMTRSIYNPITGKPEFESYVDPTPYKANGQIKETKDGEIVRFNEDGTVDVLRAHTPTELEKSQTAKNYADAAQGGKTTTQITDENYDAAKQEAVGKFKQNLGSDGKVDPEIFRQMRDRIPSTKKDDFDKWARDSGYLSAETMSMFGVVPKSSGADVTEEDIQALVTGLKNFK